MIEDKKKPLNMRMLTLTIVSVLAISLSTIAFGSPKKRFFPSYLSPTDCQDRNSMKAAEKKFKSQNILVTFNQIENSCVFINPTPNNQSAASEEAADARLKTFDTELQYLITEGKMISTCSDYTKFLVLVQKHGAPLSRAFKRCRDYERQLLFPPTPEGYVSSGNSTSNPSQNGATGLPPIFDFGTELITIFSELSIQRNAYVDGLRIRFVRAERPEIEPEAPKASQLLLSVPSWICTNNPTFTNKLGALANSDAKEIFPLTFDVTGFRVEDSHGYLYNIVNAYDFTATDSVGEGTMRTLRVEYFCEKETHPSLCTFDESDLVVLLIEESSRSQGLLAGFLSWLSSPLLKTDDLQNKIYDYMAAKSWTARTNYVTEKEKDCKKRGLLTGCEVAFNYIECWNDVDFSPADWLTKLISQEKKQPTSSEK